MNGRPVVLVVDDRPENLITIEAVLEPLDVTIEKALRAQTALHFLLENDPAVILLDVEMPDMDGFETAQLIRQRPRSRDIPIIFVTAVDRGGAAIREGYELGAVDYIVKPFQPDILRWKVSVFAELHRSRRRERLLIEEQARRGELEAAERRARLLADISATLAFSIDRETILSRLIERFVPGFADCAVIFKREQADALRFDSAAGCGEAEDLFPRKTLLTYRAEDPVFGVLNNPSPILIENLAANDYSRLSGVHRDFVQRLKFQSGIFIALQGRKEATGILALYRRALGRRSSTEHLFIGELSDRIALTLSNIDLYTDSQRANRAKDEFLAIVSHELRTPLVTILGWANILLSREMSPEAAEKALHTIQRSAKLQNDLISDILDFSRIATGKFSMDIEDVDIKTILEQTMEAMRPLAEAKRIDLAAEIAGQSGIVAGDPNRLHQILSNLVSNAIKFTPEGGQVAVTLDSTDERVVVQIKDTGIGIGPEFLPRAFEPFVQADTSNTRSYPGLGLGLAIVRHLVELHGGQIGVTSEGRGHGATFTVTLPARLSEIRAS
jgi:signal transduction histidine kinase/FixJ family two-component response regulator